MMSIAGIRIVTLYLDSETILLLGSSVISRPDSVLVVGYCLLMKDQNGSSQGERDVLDSLLWCLSNSTRRQILMALADHNPRDMTEFESPPFSPVSEETEATKIALHHSYLPRFDDAGFINWNVNQILSLGGRISRKCDHSLLS